MPTLNDFTVEFDKLLIDGDPDGVYLRFFIKGKIAYEMGPYHPDFTKGDTITLTGVRILMRAHIVRDEESPL